MNGAVFAILFAAGLALVGSGQEKKPEEKKPLVKPEPFAPGFIQGEYAITSGRATAFRSTPTCSGTWSFASPATGSSQPSATGPSCSNTAYKLDTTKFPWAVGMTMTAPKEGKTTGLATRAGTNSRSSTRCPASAEGRHQVREGAGDAGHAGAEHRGRLHYRVGRARRQPIPAAVLKDAIVRITGGRIVGTDRDRNEFLYATYTLNMNKNPWELELKVMGPKDDTTRGLVKRDGNTLTLIYAQPGAEAPKEFKTKEGQVMFSLRGFILDPLPPPNKFSSSP